MITDAETFQAWLDENPQESEPQASAMRNVEISLMKADGHQVRMFVEHIENELRGPEAAIAAIDMHRDKIEWEVKAYVEANLPEIDHVYVNDAGRFDPRPYSFSSEIASKLARPVDASPYAAKTGTAAVFATAVHEDATPNGIRPNLIKRDIAQVASEQPLHIPDPSQHGTPNWVM